MLGLSARKPKILRHRVYLLLILHCRRYGFFFALFGANRKTQIKQAGSYCTYASVSTSRYCIKIFQSWSAFMFSDYMVDLGKRYLLIQRTKNLWQNTSLLNFCYLFIRRNYLRLQSYDFHMVAKCLFDDKRNFVLPLFSARPNRLSSLEIAKLWSGY